MDSAERGDVESRIVGRIDDVDPVESRAPFTKACAQLHEDIGRPLSVGQGAHEIHVRDEGDAGTRCDRKSPVKHCRAYAARLKLSGDPKGAGGGPERQDEKDHPESHRVALPCDQRGNTCQEEDPVNVEAEASLLGADDAIQDNKACVIQDYLDWKQTCGEVTC